MAGSDTSVNPEFVVVCFDGQVWLAQSGVMGTADRPHMRDRANMHYTPKAQVKGTDAVNDAYSNAQTLALWLNLGVAEWQRREGVASDGT